MDALVGLIRGSMNVLGIAWPLLAFLAALGWVERLARRRRAADSPSEPEDPVGDAA